MCPSGQANACIQGLPRPTPRGGVALARDEQHSHGLRYSTRAGPEDGRVRPPAARIYSWSSEVRQVLNHWRPLTDYDVRSKPLPFKVDTKPRSAKAEALIRSTYKRALEKIDM